MTNLLTNIFLQALSVIVQMGTNDQPTGSQMTLQDGSRVPIVNRVVTTQEVYDVGIILNGVRISLFPMPRQTAGSELVAGNTPSLLSPPPTNYLQAVSDRIRDQGPDIRDGAVLGRALKGTNPKP